MDLYLIAPGGEVPVALQLEGVWRFARCLKLDEQRAATVDEEEAIWPAPVAL
jgi:hypothetical protein